MNRKRQGDECVRATLRTLHRGITPLEEDANGRRNRSCKPDVPWRTLGEIRLALVCPRPLPE
jgi:hypothetical protein